MNFKDLYPISIRSLDIFSQTISMIIFYLLVPYLRKMFHASYLECGLIILVSVTSNLFVFFGFSFGPKKFNKCFGASYKRCSDMLLLSLTIGVLLGFPAIFWLLKINYTDSSSVFFAIFGIVFGAFLVVRYFVSSFVAMIAADADTKMSRDYSFYGSMASRILGMVAMILIFLLLPFDPLSDMYILSFFACSLGALIPIPLLYCLCSKNNTKNDHNAVDKNIQDSDTALSFFSKLRTIHRTSTLEMWVFSLAYLSFFMVMSSSLFFQVDWFVSFGSFELNDAVKHLIYPLIFGVSSFILVNAMTCCSKDFPKNISDTFLMCVAAILSASALFSIYYNPSNSWFILAFTLYGAHYLVDSPSYNIFTYLFNNPQVTGPWLVYVRFYGILHSFGSICGVALSSLILNRYDSYSMLLLINAGLLIFSSVSLFILGHLIIRRTRKAKSTSGDTKQARNETFKETSAIILKKLVKSL